MNKTFHFAACLLLASMQCGIFSAIMCSDEQLHTDVSRLEGYLRLITPNVLKNILGFDPGFNPALITATPQHPNQTVTVCFWAHGFGDYSKQEEPLIVEKNGVLSISFDFYYSANIEQTQGPGPDIFKVPFGQDLDTLTLLAIFAKTREKLISNGFSPQKIKFNIFAHSMGAATTINALEAIMHPDGYRHFWERIGYQDKGYKGMIDLGCRAEIQGLANCIDNVYLACPLMSLKKLIASKLCDSGSVFCFVGDLVGICGKTLLGLLNKTYSAFKAEPIDNLEKILKDKDQPPFKKMVINLAQFDQVVGNLCDQQLKKIEKEYNSPATFVVNVGAEKGHVCTPNTNRQFKKIKEAVIA